MVLCLMLLAVVGFGWWRIALHFEIQNRFAALRESGLPTSGAEFNRWLAPLSDANNGALQLGEAFQRVRNFSDSRSNEVGRLLVLERTNLWSAETRLLARDYVALNQPLLEEVRVILKARHFRFPVDYSYGPNTLLPHLASLKELAYIFALHALVAAEAGNPAWIDDISSLLRLGSTLEGEPLVISFLVRAAIVNIAVKTTEKNLSQGPLDLAAIKKLQADFTAVATVSNLLSRAFVGELALTAPAFRLSRAEAERISAADENNSADGARQRFAGKPNPFLWFTGFFERDLNFYLATMTKNIALASNSPPAILTLNPHVKDAGDTARARYYILSAMLLPAFSKVANREVTTQANLRLVVTALAIEQYRISHGRLPARLGELVPNYLAVVPTDPFDGAPLRYLRPASGYVLYSIGDDLHDDGGRERPKSKKSSDKTSYDQTLIVTR